MSDTKKSVSAKPQTPVRETSSKTDIARFMKAASKSAVAKDKRLLFALDATMSRQPTWDRACQIQASMFETTSQISGLVVQLIYFRGFGECKASKWVTNGKALAEMMTRIDCRGGTTQIGKVLLHSIKETRKNNISAMVYIGDAMEENVDELCAKAGELGLLGTRVFIFQEGNDAQTESAFREIARLTRGAYMRLSSTSAKELENLLQAVAAYVTGGPTALEAHGGKAAKAILEQLKH